MVGLLVCLLCTKDCIRLLILGGSLSNRMVRVIAEDGSFVGDFVVVMGLSVAFV